MSAEAQTFRFEAETRQLLDLMIHSLYSSKEIFLRELISNASDALDRLRFDALTRPELLDGAGPAEIRLEADPAARILTIHDNGIGMSRDEVIANIGTIARSGTREVLEKLRQAQAAREVQTPGDTHPAAAPSPEFIGQFGVGFYSSFMVSDRIVLVTRRAGEKTATRWESVGDGTYTVSATERGSIGTSVTLHLKPVDEDNGLKDATSEWVLGQIVHRYSDFVTYPIRMKVFREQGGESPVPKPDAEKVIVAEDRTLNSMKTIWSRPQKDVPPEEYREFYRHISHDWTEPNEIITMKAEGAIEYSALLFIPAKAPNDLYYQASKSGLQLYVKKVRIMEHCEDLLPHYLRFVKGVVDSPDPPLNVSREILQHSREIVQIRRNLTRKVLDTLGTMREQKPEKYLESWDEFGRCLKEGLSSDFDNKEKLSSLLLFQSSADPVKLTSLVEYVMRMKDDQKEVFYLTGEVRSAVESSPHLEGFKDKGYEVLFLTDPVDELMLQTFHEFDGKRLKSVGKGKVTIEKEDEVKAREEQEKQHASLLEFIQKKLDEHVKQVRLTKRLTVSPACLVVADHDYSPHLEKLLMKGKGGGPKQRRILELNPSHPLFARMQERFEKQSDDPLLGDYTELLYGQALLAESAEIPDPARFGKLVVDLMVRGI